VIVIEHAIVLGVDRSASVAIEVDAVLVKAGLLALFERSEEQIGIGQLHQSIGVVVAKSHIKGVLRDAGCHLLANGFIYHLVHDQIAIVAEKGNLFAVEWLHDAKSEVVHSKKNNNHKKGM
jgi:hypothetical protein